MIANSGKTKVKCKRRSRSRRWGAATVELAVCLPVLVLLVFSSIEACNMIFLRNSLSACSYEGIRVAIKDEATNGDVNKRCQAILDSRNISGTTITLDPSNVKLVDKGDPITVTVAATCDANSVMPPWFFGGRALASSSSMVKE